MSHKKTPYSPEGPPGGATEGLPDVLLEDEVGEPPQFKVLLHNDDYTTMEFVIRVLRDIFKKGEAEAHRIMLTVHTEGVGVCGVYPREMAETKVDRVHALARREGYPLKSSMEAA